MTSVKMKELLGGFEVKENIISPFCSTFENTNEFRDALMLYFLPSMKQQKKDRPSTNMGGKISDVDVDNEMPNIETVKSLITKGKKYGE